MSTRYAIVCLGIAMSLGCFPNGEAPSTASAPPKAAPAAPAPSAPAATSPAPAAAPPAAATPPAGITGSVSDGSVTTPAPVAPAPTAPAGTASPATTPVNNNPAAPPAAPGTERVTAKAGEGKRGQSLKNETGIFVEPAKAFFRVEQRTVFEFQVPQALSLFKASEGRAPKSQEEFMTKIIAANNIKLPELPAGNKYVYDPQREELMVEKPVQK